MFILGKFQNVCNVYAPSTASLQFFPGLQHLLLRTKPSTITTLEGLRCLRLEWSLTSIGPFLWTHGLVSLKPPSSHTVLFILLLILCSIFCTRVYLCVHVYVGVCVHTCTCVCMYTCVPLCMDVYLCVLVCACVYVCT